MKIILLFILFILASQVVVAQIKDPWRPCYNTFGRDVYSFKSKGDTVYAGTDNGILFSIDNGESWTNLGSTSDIIYTMEILGNNIFTGGNFGGISVSIDNGKSWTQKNNGYLRSRVNEIVTKDTILYAATNSGVFLSLDLGNNWIAKNEGLQSITVQTIAIHGDNILAGTKDKGVFLSTDNGNSWKAINNGLPFLEISALAIHNSIIFIGSKRNGVYMSIDSGNSWTPRNNGFTEYSVKSMKSINDVLFVGMFYGYTYHSNDNGTSWKTNRGGTVLAFFNFGQNIFAGLQEAGGIDIAKLSDFGVTDVEEQPASPSSSLRISPMPISGDYLTISNIPASASELHIYSLLGEIVHSESLNGAERRQMNVSGLPAGVYYLRVGMETRMINKL